MNDINRQMAMVLIEEAYKRAGRDLPGDDRDAYAKAMEENDPRGVEEGDFLAEAAVTEATPWLHPRWEGANLVLDFEDA